jgi:hypothetical protein
MRHAALTVVLLITWLAAVPAAPDVAAGQADDLLRGWFGLNAGHLRALHRRRAVVRSLDTVDDREIATVGVVRMRVGPSFFVERMRDVESRAGSELVLETATFSTPARPGDLQALRFEADMIRALGRCRVHDCDVQLSRKALARFSGISASMRRSAAPETMRAVLADMVRDYQQRGAAALMTYADDDEEESAAVAFERLVSDPPAVLRRLPTLHDHLTRFPESTGEGIEDILYWSRDRIGPAIIVSVTHLAITGPADHGIAAAAVSRQLYASRYFDASLGITLVLDRREGSSQVCDIVYVNRSRVDVFGGIFGGLTRLVARHRVRSGMARALIALRDRLEGEFSRQGVPTAATVVTTGR